MKKLLITIGLLIACQWLAAQNLPLIKPIDDYSFAHFECNHLLYPGDSTAMERFFQKLDSVVFLGEGNVNTTVRSSFFLISTFVKSTDTVVFAEVSIINFAV